MILVAGGAVCALACAYALPPAGTFTTTVDFSLGRLKSVVADPPDQLRLSYVSETEPYIWVANHTTGRVTKIDTRTGAIVGQYYSTMDPSKVLPDNLPDQIDIPPQGSGDNSPSRTAVDLDGSMYVANRAHTGWGLQGSVTKIAGSKAYGLDRNNNGCIDTSTGEGDLLADDECLLWTAKVGAPGTIPRGVAVDAQNNVWVGTFTDGKLYKFDGQTGALMETMDLRAETGNDGIEIYGIAIGNDGLIYTTGLGSRSACCVAPTAPAGSKVRVIGLRFPGYGLAVDKNGREWIGRWQDGSDGCEVQIANWRDNPATLSYGSSSVTGRTKGVAVDGDGSVWVANFDANKVLEFASDGQYVTSYDVASGPIGVAVDAAGSIWTVGSTTCTRINPADGHRDDFPAGGETYSYSDMTGFQLRNYTARQGSWSVTCDGGGYHAAWHTVSWNAWQPEGTLVKVEARVAESLNALETRPWFEVTSGVQLQNVVGRYIDVRATLRIVSGDVSPILYDLTVGEPTPGPNPTAVDIRGAKQAAEAPVVTIAGQKVTHIEIGLFCIEEPGRNAGIAVKCFDPVECGDVVSVIGETQTIDGERILVDGLVLSRASGTPLQPVGMATFDLGGGALGYQPAIVGSYGLNNVGLLVRVCGRVTASGTGYFYLSDGAKCKDGSGAFGVKVLCGTSRPPPVGSYVAVTGASSAFLAPKGVSRQVRMSSITYYEYHNAFSSTPGVEWSNRTTSTTPIDARAFLGEFSDESVTLSLSGLAPHSQMTLSFDLFLMKSWDAAHYGPDIVDVTVVGGPTLLHSTFALWSDYWEQTYPDPYPDGPLHPARTGAVENNTLGYTFEDRPMDCVYHTTYTIPHTASAVQISFSGLNLQGVDDESWGLDNVRIQLR